ncbi:putative selenate ABC transporter substrate-binding protein [Fischerella major NIES-592]|uniref:Putative selenate ABC transporter substrate-binding protein n=1 Tax=Fischerella major NIES-592 TaxID=210994 RepID=A0A1U7GYF4_9CYAN|nr:putative selenate ABC transporter substrate-binding protein [Fischerella major]OKH13342.1 putative selenate ABC transporter substrate-binding protein [Fischerella major NIES-592]
MKKLLFSGLLLILLPLTACSEAFQTSAVKQVQPLVTGAIPDQDPEKLQRQYTKLAAYLQKELGVPVEYKPVTDYTATVTAFKVGDLDLVWFGGLTGVQARLQVPGAEAIAQRDVDEKFHSVFIANKKTGLQPFKNTNDLQKLKGKTFTFGSESSTSGRLMPQYFLEQAGVKLTDFKGQPGFSGDHDKTIKLVEAGTYEVGAVNEKVWSKRVDSKEVDLNKVEVIWRTPAYYDYHWVINPQVKQRYGEDFVNKVQAAFLKLDPKVPEHKEILDLLQASKFIPTKNENYKQIEEIGRQIGKIK